MIYLHLSVHTLNYVVIRCHSGVAITSVHQFHWFQESLRHDRHNEALWDPLKIVSIIRGLYDGMTCQVIHNIYLSSPFTVTTGLKQACCSDRWSFRWSSTGWSNHGPTQRFIMDFVKTLEDLDFADDIGLPSHIQDTGVARQFKWCWPVGWRGSWKNEKRCNNKA